MLGKYLKTLQEKSPLIHNITNYVTVNDCANILLACGASPIMADDEAEASEICSICSGLNINIGTLNERTIKSMLIAGKKANELSRPVLLDPVGAGASALRTDTAKMLMENINFTIIRGNISEIKALALGSGGTKGVDASLKDVVTEENLDSAVSFARDFSERTGSVVIITGAIDIVSDKNKTFIIRNGHPLMARITGSGCMLSAMTAAYAAANLENVLEASASALCAMGICGEKAFATMEKNQAGNSSFRNYLIDEVYKLSPAALDEGANYEIR